MASSSGASFQNPPTLIIPWHWVLPINATIKTIMAMSSAFLIVRRGFAGSFLIIIFWNYWNIGQQGMYLWPNPQSACNISLGSGNKLQKKANKKYPVKPYKRNPLPKQIIKNNKYPITTKAMDNTKQLVKQLEYYLSNENLQNDEFFYDQVAADKDHFVDIKCFLNCNKVKKMGVTKVQQIVQAVKQASTIELNKEGTMLRRKDMVELPEFKAKKKVKGDEHEHEGRNSNPYDKMETIIFTLSLQKDEKVPFRYIQQALLKGHNVFSPYVRFNKDEGNFAIEKKLVTPELVEKFEKEGLKVGETVLKVKKAEGKDLDTFWQKHGHHYNGIIDNLRKEHNKKQKTEKKGNPRSNKKLQQFQFGDQKYTDINQIKSLFKNILCRNPNNKPLPQKQADLVKELLSYHDRGDEKLKNLKHFVVDVNPSYVDTRCLFVVREDGTREDFSIVKCINNLESKVAGH